MKNVIFKASFCREFNSLHFGITITEITRSRFQIVANYRFNVKYAYYVEGFSITRCFVPLVKNHINQYFVLFVFRKLKMF